LNLAFKLKLLSLNKIIGPTDCVFLPNLNQFHLDKKTKLFLTVHDLSPAITPGFYNLKRRLWHSFLNYREAFFRAQAIFAVSQHTKLDLVRLYGVSEHKVHVVYPGVDSAALLTAATPTGLRQTRNKYLLPVKFFLFINTIEPRKNLEGLLKAFENLRSDTELVIAGKKGWSHSKIFDLIEKSPKKNRIRYLGYVSEQDKAALVKMAEAVVYPSFYEGFGFQPLEAARLGTPVIMSGLTSLPEVLGGGALMVNPYNHTEILEALETILSNPELRTNLLKKAEELSEGFSWQKSAKQILSILETA
jgi:glycosyltransferase involved in cell wall biosynthesis